MTTQTIIRRGTTWQGVATFDDGVTLHAPGGQTRIDADQNLEACLAGQRPWCEHTSALVGASNDLDEAGYGMITERPRLIMDVLRSPLTPIEWPGGDELSGEQALKAVVREEITSAVNAVHVLARVIGCVYVPLLNDERAQAVRATPMWQGLRGHINEVIEVGKMTVEPMGLQPLITRTAGGFATTITWFPELDCDPSKGNVPEEVIDHYEGLTVKRVDAMTEEWVANPTFREGFRSYAATLATPARATLKP